MIQLHRYWSGPLPGTEPMVGRRVRSLGHDLYDWTDDTLPVAVVEWLDAGSDQVVAADRLRHRANMVRLWLLNEHGGVWVDHDVIPFIDLGTLPRPFAASHNGTLCNCVLGFDAGHPMIRQALDIGAVMPHDRRGQSVSVSGERLLEHVRTPDVTLFPLPFDKLGRWQNPESVWVDHVYTSARNR